MDIGLVGELFLRPAFGMAQLAQISGEALVYIHTRQLKPVSTIDLQTISDIRT